MKQHPTIQGVLDIYQAIQDLQKQNGPHAGVTSVRHFDDGALEIRLINDDGKVIKSLRVEGDDPYRSALAARFPEIGPRSN